jgi:hypothetical protein
MEQFAKAEFPIEVLAGPVESKSPDPNDPLGLHNLDRFTQVPVAGVEQRLSLLRREFVRSSVPSRLLQKSQGAIVQHEVCDKKILSVSKS